MKSSYKLISPGAKLVLTIVMTSLLITFLAFALLSQVSLQEAFALSGKAQENTSKSEKNSSEHSEKDEILKIGSHPSPSDASVKIDTQKVKNHTSVVETKPKQQKEDQAAHENDSTQQSLNNKAPEEESGIQNLNKGALLSPLDSYAPTSEFGERSNSLTGEKGEFHEGQDFADACGAGVRASAPGVVTYAGWHEHGGGNRIEIDHGNGLKTSYNHLSAIDVKIGQHVNVRDHIGGVGSTGSSTGCHLHFEVIVDGKKIDPLDWL